MTTYPKEVITELRWYEYPGIKPFVEGTYIFAHGTSIFSVYWDGERFIYDDGQEISSLSNSTKYWAEPPLPQDASNGPHNCKQDQVEVNIPLTETEIAEENRLYVKMCKEKGLKKYPPLRLKNGSYNPKAFSLKIQGVR